MVYIRMRECQPVVRGVPAGSLPHSEFSGGKLQKRELGTLETMKPLFSLQLHDDCRRECHWVTLSGCVQLIRSTNWLGSTKSGGHIWQVTYGFVPG